MTHKNLPKWNDSEIEPFGLMADIEQGLSSNPKYIPSKYFYDASGSILFEKIMNLDEYYLTDSELEIFKNASNSIVKQHFKKEDGILDIIELGAGDGLKTIHLLKAFLNEEIDAEYFPVDISKKATNSIMYNLAKQFENLKVIPVNFEYQQAFKWMAQRQGQKKLILFLGSSIGNFNHKESLGFLHDLSSHLNNNDHVIIGFDLKKDPNIILRAYNDNRGITASFNLNLLQRINKELGADFNVNNFFHYQTYEPVEGYAKSFLISKIAQKVHIKKLHKDFHFYESEPVSVEISRKYDIPTIENIASEVGWRIDDYYFDQKKYFVDVIFSK